MERNRIGQSAALALALLLATAAAPATAQQKGAEPATARLAGEAPDMFKPCPSDLAHCPSGLPDRIVLTAGADPAREMAVAYRTDARQAAAIAQLAPALDGPGKLSRTEATGSSRPLPTANGDARYHHVRFSGLRPDTAYVYRLRGAAGWSEWIPFRTAAAAFRPFRFVYFGDTQNNVLETGSRVIRQALHAAGGPALVVHAGDLVQQRDGDDFDYQWGEWVQAGGFHYAMTPQLVAPGNHEYLKVQVPDGAENDVLAAHWSAQFALPANGAPGTEATSYFTDYQGVRFIVLDTQSALDLGTLQSQTDWLKAVLAGRAGDTRWTVVVMHHPLFTCARPNNPTRLLKAWRQLFTDSGVDLVLQGHDHCYSRVTDPEGGKAAFRNGRRQEAPVYIVSVVGEKMYALNGRATSQPDRTAEDTQLYQLIDVEADALRYRAHTATGRLYDAFDLVRSANGRKRVVEPALPLAPIRLCTGEVGPDGVPCTSQRR